MFSEMVEGEPDSTHLHHFMAPMQNIEGKVNTAPPSCSYHPTVHSIPISRLTDLLTGLVEGRVDGDLEGLTEGEAGLLLQDAALRLAHVLAHLFLWSVK